MASTNYRTRVIYSDKSSGSSSNYKLLAALKSLSSPIGSPNTAETTTMEDNQQTFIEGIYKSDEIKGTANLEKDKFSAISALKGKQIEFIFLYGSDGLGSQLKVRRNGTVSVVPTETSGTDGVLEMEITIIPSSVSEIVTDEITVTTDDNVTFTVSEA